MKRFVTEYSREEQRLTSYVDALDFEHAQQLCDARGHGEKVLGTLLLVVKNDVPFERVMAMARAIANEEHYESPDAADFGPCPQPER